MVQESFYKIKQHILISLMINKFEKSLTLVNLAFL